MSILISPSILESASFNNSLQSTRWMFVQTFYAKMSKNTIFASNRHNIRCYTHSHKVQQGLQSRKIYAIVNCKRLHKFKPNTTARQVFVWVSIICSFRVKHCHCARQCLVCRVVVTDNKINSQRRSIIHLLNSFDATIQRNDEFHIILFGIINPRFRNSIPLFVSIRYVIIQLRRLGIRL